MDCSYTDYKMRLIVALKTICLKVIDVVLQAFVNCGKGLSDNRELFYFETLHVSFIILKLE